MNQRSTMVANKASKLLEKAAAQIKRSTISGKSQKGPNNSNFDTNQDSQLFVTSTPNSYSKVTELSKNVRGLEDTNNTTIKQTDSRSEFEEKDIENFTVTPKSKHTRPKSLTPSPAKNEYDEIQAYLQNLSKKTKTEKTSTNKENSGHKTSESQVLSNSDLSLSLSELSLVGKAPHPNTSATLVEKDLKSSKVIAKANANVAPTSRIPSSRVSTALERASFYDDKYRKARNEPSKNDILDSDSDLSLNEFKKSETHLSISVSERLADADEVVSLAVAVEDVQKKVASVPVFRSKPEESDKPTPLMELHNLHTVEELLESLDISPAKVLPEAKDSHDTVTSLSQPVSEIVEEFEELTESIAEAPVDSEKDPSPSADDELVYTIQSESSVATGSAAESHKSNKTNSSVQNEEPYTEPLSESKSELESDASGNVFKNVYLGSLDEVSQLSMKSFVKDNTVVIPSTRSTKTETKSASASESKTKTPEKISALVDRADHRHHSKRNADAAVQTIIGTSTSLTDLLMNPPLVNYMCELENFGAYAGVTRYMVRQETIEALISTSPGILAANDLLQQQLVLTTHFLASQQSLYLAHVSALQPDYNYTTWENTKEEIGRYRRKQKLSRGRHKKIKE